MKTTVAFAINGSKITGELEVISRHWSFDSDDQAFRKLYPHGLSSFMLYGDMTPEQQTIIREVLSLLKCIDRPSRQRSHIKH